MRVEHRPPQGGRGPSRKMAVVKQPAPGPSVNRAPRIGQRLRIRFRRSWRTTLIAYLFLIPGLALFTVFVLRPTVEVFVLSGYSWDGVSSDRTWIGLDNFRRLLTDPVFGRAFRNNLVWLFVVVTFNVSVGLVTAAVLARNVKGRLLFQLAFFLPVIQASIVTAMVWRWIYNPSGILNRTLSAVGLDNLARGWLGDTTFALPALALAAAWAGFGLAIVIFLAGIQGIDQSLYDAAKVDGANGRQMFFHVTVPQLRHVITVVLLLELIGAFQTFDIIWATTRGGPVGATEVLATYMFKRGFTQAQFGYGAAIAVVFMIIVLVSAAIAVAVREREED
jgi:raffinose/stachyose/melibiose transport system permease protein